MVWLVTRSTRRRSTCSTGCFSRTRMTANASGSPGPAASWRTRCRSGCGDGKQFGEHPGDLGGEVVAVRAVPRRDVGAIPAGPGIAFWFVDRQRKDGHRCVPGGIEEVGEREPAVLAAVAHAV